MVNRHEHTHRHWLFLGFRAIQKTPIIHISSGFIWGTPARWPRTCL
jgi:hypothetical protein